MDLLNRNQSRIMSLKSIILNSIDLQARVLQFQEFYQGKKLVSQLPKIMILNHLAELKFQVVQVKLISQSRKRVELKLILLVWIQVIVVAQANHILERIIVLFFISLLNLSFLREILLAYTRNKDLEQ